MNQPKKPKNKNNHTPKDEGDWEREFDGRWVSEIAHLTPNPAQGVYCGDKNEIINFIRQIEQRAYERGKKDGLKCGCGATGNHICALNK